MMDILQRDACVQFRTMLDDRMKVCDAFPRGIPAEVWEERELHDRPMKGDGGMVFDEDPLVYNPHLDGRRF